jgi:DNA-binding SARP family transcriptional activator
MDGASGAGTRELEVRLLGPIEVERGGEPVALGGQKPRALLAVLALEPGRVVSVDRLVEALWPGDPPDTASHAIQVYVSQLRKVLGPVIATRPPGYVLEVDPESIDVHRFVRLAQEGHGALESEDAAAAEILLREALALWRGPALADFVYEPFAQTQIARVDELRTVVVEERIEADLALGRHVELVSELEALVQAERLRERPRAQLMLALYRSGRQADALAAYRDARDTLVDELGIEPGPELRELEAAILRQDESLLLEETPLARPAMQFRRLVTIVFVDVVESMALAEALDPEALGRVLHRYFETVSSAITRHGGTVEKYAGDAVMAAFGIPISHEDDALRAVRAALDVASGIAALNEQLEREHGVGLEIRVGIESGEVVSTPTEPRQRLVTGEAVGIASRLEQAAQPGEIVLGQLAARLVDHAAVLEPLGELELKGKRDPVHAYRLIDVAPVAPAFESRLDAPLVGRKRELAALRRALKRAVDGGSTQVAVLIGTPGVGKSRLAGELTRRTKGVTTLWGRCLSYGEGITYWPLREALGQSGADGRHAVLEALEAETPLPAPEIALLFRRFCETLARERPLIVVFDDVHWAEPTFLELVEHLADKGSAPILVVCVARDELVVERPELLAERANATRIVLDALSANEVDALLDGLGATSLETDQRARIAEAAEGNPFFLEQLLALALEGGLTEGALPETVQALLAARLDRLGPGERAVLERGAVIGKEFRLDDVVALLEPEAAPTTEVHVQALAARGFVRPTEQGEFRFRHVLVQEAVYRAAPKRLRAELHERSADRLDETAPDMAELDEFVGYHLERAYRLRTELGESDRHTDQLAEDGGRRLGEAGFRAFKRGDMPATVSLLGRAVALLPTDDEFRNELMCELGIAQYSANSDTDASTAILDEAVAGALRARQRRVELRGRIEAAYVRLLTAPEGAARALLELAESAVPTFEAFDDARSLGRAWLLIGYVQGGIHGNHAAWEEAEQRALEYYRRASFPSYSCLQQIAAALYWGPTPVALGMERCSNLLADETIGRFGRAAILPFLGGLHAQAGELSKGRALVDEAEHVLTELGAIATAVVICGTVRADVELLAENLLAAETTLREQCEHLERVHDRAHLAVRAAKLAETLYRQGRLDEAERWAGVSRANGASDDQSAQLVLVPVEAKLKTRRGALAEGRELAEEIVRLADATDGLNQIAATRLALGEVLRAAGLNREADRAIDEAVRLFERKGNVVGASKARELLNVGVHA